MSVTLTGRRSLSRSLVHSPAQSRWTEWTVNTWTLGQRRFASVSLISALRWVDMWLLTWITESVNILLLFLVVIYRRYIAQCRLKSVGFTTIRKINSLRVLRN